MRTCLAIFILLGLCHSAAATTLSYVGSLDPNNPNEVFLTTFHTGSAAELDIQTFGYGGGINGAGAVIPSGGFDPYISLFAGIGPSATFLASDDDGSCPPGTADGGNCFDSTLTVANLAAGDYTVALTQPSNFSFAENLGTGTLGDGFIGLAADYRGRTSDFAFDISSPAIPEPTTLSLLFGPLLFAAVCRSFRIGKTALQAGRRSAHSEEITP